ncbi:hypothetical protein O4328_39525 [Rhodococcus opacus]|uniref:Uncharacterized protein n=1 Tax=Rhodococcus opacus TaxID=37919 RepID=A0AAX3YRR1_RHOOP|nr:hypothetical protein [Rhodococcus opacus]MCZ4589663.1 hypothetical protein [Rhodococcus opacus]WLF51179.1 hypothetical protein Q5707_38100 [Rhodococcus opacus]
MCDGINDPAGPRRCPSQRGERRREYRRAMYAAQKAAAIIDPTGPDPDDAAPPGECTAERIAAARRAVDDAYAAYTADPTTESVRRYEAAVRSAGSLVATEVDAEIATRLDPTELERIDAARSHVRELLAQQIAEKRAVEQEIHDMTRQLRWLGPEERVERLTLIQAKTADFNARTDSIRAATVEVDNLELRRGAAEGRIAAEVLGRYRDYGTVVPEVHPMSTSRAQALTAEAANAFPSAWMRDSSASTRLLVKESKARAYYQHKSMVRISDNTDYDYSDDPDSEQTWTTRKAMPPAPEKAPVERMRELDWPDGTNPKWVAVRDPETRRWAWKLRMTNNGLAVMSELRVPTAAAGPDESRRIAIHEMSHRMEAINPRIGPACISFRDRRTSNPDGTLHPKQRYAKTEVVRPDEFVDVYVGKDYKSTVHSEVMSMGMESVFGGSHGGLQGHHGYRADPEHRNLILGLCATA